MNLYFVCVINIRFICDGKIYLVTYLEFWDATKQNGGGIPFCVWFLKKMASNL